MKLIGDNIQISASDLVNFLGCKHLTEVDRKTAKGEIDPPDWENPALALLQKKGQEHETAYVEHLKTLGLSVCELDGQSVTATLEAISKGYDIITQARFKKDGWVGIADILRKVEGTSKLEDWYYEIEDTKLAKETKAGTVLQLCLYSDLLGEIQGRIPDNMIVVKPGEGFPMDVYRYSEFEAYYRFVKNKFQEVMSSVPIETYPFPVGKCDTCRWWKQCNKQWHDDDHLSLIAGIRSNQIKELDQQEIKTLETYAKEEKPFRKKPEQGNEDTYRKIHNQAQIQLKGREESKLLYDLLPIEPLRGLNRLPSPSDGDIYFDIEGDRFHKDGGLEYLLGFANRTTGSETDYKFFWAKDYKEEKKAFSHFMTMVMSQWEKHPDMHIYHYAPYEPSAIKRLASRHAIFEEEVDQLLRAERFIDLYSVIKETLIASVESYSLKDVEHLADFVRSADLRQASGARRRMSVALDFNEFSSFPETDLRLIEEYNKDDCLATEALHNWLESIYQNQLGSGIDLNRPEIQTGDASDYVTEQEEQARRLYEALIIDLGDDPSEWSKEEQAKWLLAHQIEFYRRELKSAIWEYYRLNDLEPHELISERKGIYGLKHLQTLPESKRVPIDRYVYPAQEISLEIGKELHEPKGGKIGTIHNFSLEHRTVDIKKTGATASIHPYAVHSREVISPGVLVPSLFSFAESIVNDGVDGNGAFRAGRDLLLKKSPRLSSNDDFEIKENESSEDAALRLALDLDNSILPVQGPPGTGKTYLGGGLIAELLKRGKKVGVTAVSHKVIRNLLDTASERAVEKGIAIQIKQKPKSGTKIEMGDTILIKNKEAAVVALNQGAVVGGTSWLWADDEFEGMLDYLFVDEAGQMSLTNVLTISRSTKNIILLGDPQQLEQPKKGAHPEGADISALEHILDGHATIPVNKGLFLGTTWRLNPKITDFTSSLYYEGRLSSKEELEGQIIEGDSPFVGGGLFNVSVDHMSNQSQSLEEVETIKEIVQHLLESNLTWTNRLTDTQPLKPDDILIVAPYNAQVSALKEHLPEMRIGTVDKFQGQEAPVVIYSMTSSSPDDAPRGMSFLYNPNRLNVATSRAQCICILVAAPSLFEAECHTVDQMKWANGLCMFGEMAKKIDL